MGLMLRLNRGFTACPQHTAVVKYSILGILINVIYVQKGFHHQETLGNTPLKKEVPCLHDSLDPLTCTENL